MKYERIRNIGNILHALQTHRISSLGSPKSFIRVTYTHQILREEEKNFESLIAFLVKSHSIITPSDFLRIYNHQQPIDGVKVLVSFDDGLRSSYWAMKNILSKYGVKAVMFVPTRILELKTPEEMKRFAWENLNFKEGPAPAVFREEEYLTMGKKEILDLQKHGHAVYPHTYSHRRLNEIHDEQTAVKELVEPKKVLQELLQVPMEAFAFPVGTERVISSFCLPYLKREYRYCFTALAGKNRPQTNPYFIHRDCMNANYDLDHVRHMQDGVFDSYYQYKMAKLKKGFGYEQTK